MHAHDIVLTVSRAQQVDDVNVQYAHLLVDSRTMVGISSSDVGLHRREYDEHQRLK